MVLYIKGEKRRIVFALIMLGVIIFCSLLGGTALGVLAPAQPEGISLPIIMYHSILRDNARTGEYVITPSSLEQDMLYLKERGYTAIGVNDLIEYVYNGTPLPEKPVMLTFDDGYYNNLTYLEPLLMEYDMKAVVSAVGSYTQQYSQSGDKNPGYAYLSWEDLKQMNQRGYIEIQNHSYDMHKNSGRLGAGRKQGESLEVYSQALSDDVMRMDKNLKEKCGITSLCFTYPFGRISEESEEILKSLGFRATLSCYERLNYITREPECLFQLGRYNRHGALTTAQFMKKVGI